MRSRPILRAVPRAAATWPCGRLRVTVMASCSAGMTVPALEHAAQALDGSGRPVGEVAQRAFAHLAALAIALAQQDGGRRVPVRDGFDIHAANASRSGRAVQLTTALLHGYGFRPGEAVFPDFRRFIVMASRKLGLTLL